MNNEDLFGNKLPEPTPPQEEKKEPLGPLYDRIEKFMKGNRFKSFSTYQLIYQFNDGHNDARRYDAIRNAVRKLIKDGILTATGERENKYFHFQSLFNNQSDLEKLTLKIYK